MPEERNRLSTALDAPGLYDRYRATRHFGSLDGLRFICISAVIWHHIPYWQELTHISVLFARGHVGVDFFFVLSGYLITTLLLREESTKGSFDLRGFYWRRALRILPVYYFVVSIAAFYDIVINGRAEALEALPFYYVFLVNFLTIPDIMFLSPTWSLSVEEQYYLLWPALLLLLPRGWIIPALIALIAINVIAATGLFALVGIHAINAYPLRFAIEGATYAPILMGSLAAVLLHYRAGFLPFARALGSRGAPWICFALLLVALGAVPGSLEGWPNLLVHSLMTLMLISLVVREDNGMAPVLHLRPIVRIGQISYGVYLYHHFALAAMYLALQTLGIQSWGLLYFTYYALAILIAEISFRTLEAWFMRFRHKSFRRVPSETR